MGLKILDTWDEEALPSEVEGDRHGTIELTPAGALKLEAELLAVENLGLSQEDIGKWVKDITTAETADFSSDVIGDILAGIDDSEEMVLCDRADLILNAYYVIKSDLSSKNRQKCIDLVRDLKDWFSDENAAKTGFIGFSVLEESKRYSSEISAEATYLKLRNVVLGGSRVNLPCNAKNRLLLKSVADVIYSSDRVKNRLELVGYSRLDIGEALIRMVGWDSA